MLQRIAGLTGTILKLSLAIAIFMIGVDMQQVNADNNNGDSKKSCRAQQSYWKLKADLDSTSNCSQVHL